MDNLFTQGKSLDPRGIFLIQTNDRFWLWIGNEVRNLKLFRDAVDTMLVNLRKYERASNKDLTVVNQGEEGDEFWETFGGVRASQKYGQMADWNHVFGEVSNLNQFQ